SPLSPRQSARPAPGLPRPCTADRLNCQAPPAHNPDKRGTRLKLAALPANCRFRLRNVATCLLAVALVTGAAGCDSVRDVIDEPAIVAPPPNIVLQGTITGLGSSRPVVLQYNGQDTCTDSGASEQEGIAPCR